MIHLFCLSRYRLYVKINKKVIKMLNRQKNDYYFNIFLNLARAMYMQLEKDWDKEAKLCGISYAQQHALWLLHVQDGLTLEELGNIAIWNKSTTSALISRLEKKGLVEKRKDEDCYAWVHGPVYNSVYNLFKELKYNPIDDDRFMILKNRFEELTEQERNVIQLVLNSFGNYSGKVLEEITHQEDPWVNSRNGYSFLEPSNNLIEKNQIQLYFKKIDKEYSLRNIKEINRYINEQLELKNK